jgi:photosystem II stability/assembly factor-like uncharacterized protein
MKTPITLRVAGIALGIILLGQGCGGTATPTGPDGGVFRTSDRGTTWVQKKVLIQGPKGVSIADDVISAMAFDPQDHLTVYAGTDLHGLVYSLDGGDSWLSFTGTIAKARVQSVAVDPKDKCTVYATTANQIFKTVNCGRDWTRTWFDPKTDKVFTTVLVDWFNSTIVYVGSSDGDVFKSTDGGINFLVSKRADAAVASIAIDPSDSRILYVGTRGDGIWKTMDAGQTWLSFKQQIADYENAKRVTQMVVDTLDPKTVFAVSKYGILVSRNGGEEWKPMQLTSPPNTVEIKYLSVNPRDDKQIQYVTQNTFIYSSDGGTTWKSAKLPSNRIANVLLTDPQAGDVLYLGMAAAPKQN